MNTFASLIDLLATLAELAWLYLQLHGMRTARWVYANPDQATGAALGLLGAFLLARGSARAGLGWLAFLGSNAALIVMALRLDLPGVLVLQLGFTVTTGLGIWTWLIKPRLDWDEWRGDLAGNPTMFIWRLASFRGYRLDLHRMVAPDAWDCFHSHPATAMRVVLYGGYMEEIEAPEGQPRKWKIVPARSVSLVRPEFSHRISSLPRGVSWSLWLRGPKTHETQLRGPGWPEGSEAA